MSRTITRYLINVPCPYCGLVTSRPVAKTQIALHVVKIMAKHLQAAPDCDRAYRLDVGLPLDADRNVGVIRSENYHRRPGRKGRGALRSDSPVERAAFR